ncbi:MAG: phosphotransferase [Candidatus Tectomicrobia bacterium]|nr:phosphotransferase [Candidatus Tectomicrobia bacterium]
MSSRRFDLPELLRQKAFLRGDSGTRWLEGLSILVGELEEAWQVRLHRQLSGGTEALVLAVVQANGKPAVLKIGLPGELRKEALALRLANGVGYATLLAYDESRNAVLLERLGEKLVDHGFSIRQQIEFICETLQTAWGKVRNPNGLMTGAEKARSLAEFITVQWSELGEPCEKAIKDQALAFAEEREQAYDPTLSVLVHGDAHPWNTLRWHEEHNATTHPKFKFVDPDGLFAEPACDLSISLREWGHELLAGDALRLGKARCALLNGLTGVDEGAIWQWGFIEHVSSGLLYTQLGQKTSAHEHFSIAERWLAG